MFGMLSNYGLNEFLLIFDLQNMITRLWISFLTYNFPTPPSFYKDSLLNDVTDLTQENRTVKMIKYWKMPSLEVQVTEKYE